MSDMNCTFCCDTLINGSITEGLPCSHVFHQVCVRKWLLEKRHCPICRISISANEENIDGLLKEMTPPPPPPPPTVDTINGYNPPTFADLEDSSSSSHSSSSSSSSDDDDSLDREYIPPSIETEDSITYPIPRRSARRRQPTRRYSSNNGVARFPGTGRRLNDRSRSPIRNDINDNSNNNNNTPPSTLPEAEEAHNTTTNSKPPSQPFIEEDSDSYDSLPATSEIFRQLQDIQDKAEQQRMAIQREEQYMERMTHYLLGVTPIGGELICRRCEFPINNPMDFFMLTCHHTYHIDCAISLMQDNIPLDLSQFGLANQLQNCDNCLIPLPADHKRLTLLLEERKHVKNSL